MTDRPFDPASAHGQPGPGPVDERGPDGARGPGPGPGVPLPPGPPPPGQWVPPSAAAADGPEPAEQGPGRGMIPPDDPEVPAPSGEWLPPPTGTTPLPSRPVTPAAAPPAAGSPGSPSKPWMAMGISLVALLCLGVTTLIFAGGLLDDGPRNPLPVATRRPVGTVLPRTAQPRTAVPRTPGPTGGPGTGGPTPTVSEWQSGQIGDSSVVKLGPTETPEPGGNAPVFPSPTLPEPDHTPGVPTPLTVAQFVAYPNPLGGTRVIGIVQNTGTAAVAHIRVQGRLRNGPSPANGNDTLLGTIVLAAGAQAPFQLIIAGDAPETSQVQVDAQAEAATPAEAAAWLAPDILQPTDVELAARVTLGGQSLTGQLTNTGTVAAANPRVLAVGLDKDGQIVDVGKHSGTLKTVPPGGSLPFRVNFVRTEVEVVTTNVLVLGQPAP